MEASTDTKEEKAVNLSDDGRARRLVDGAEKELQALTVTADEICSMKSLHDPEHFLGHGASYQVSLKERVKKLAELANKDKALSRRLSLTKYPQYVQGHNDRLSALLARCASLRKLLILVTKAQQSVAEVEEAVWEATEQGVALNATTLAQVWLCTIEKQLLHGRPRGGGVV